MSIDVNYYSFSPKRADKEWPHFIEDLSVLRKKHAGWQEEKKHSEEFSKKREEVEKSFETRIDKARNKIFSHFSNKGYVIPGIEWGTDEGVNQFGDPMIMTDEGKMDYLGAYGCVFPRGIDPKDKDAPYLMLRTDAPELEAEYRKVINEFRDALASIDIPHRSPGERENVTLNKRQEKMDNEGGLNYLVYENSFDNDQLIYELKILDIYYGSIANEYFESPKIESTFLEEIVDISKLKNEQGIPTRDEWIRLFQQIKREPIEKVSTRLMKTYSWDKDEAEWEITDYLRSVHPVAKDLKSTMDAIFIRSYGGTWEVEPASAELLLLERAKQHAKKYKGLLAPVL